MTQDMACLRSAARRFQCPRLMTSWQAPAVRRRSSEKGTELVEFGLTLIPFLGLVFLVINIAWMFFAKSSLQEAVREGVRFGVTCQVLPGQSGLANSVRQVVQQYSAGFVNSNNAQSNVSVQFFSPSNLSTPLSGPSSTLGGNVIQVSVSGISVTPLASLLISHTPLTLGASSSDVMESPPNGIPCSP